GKNLVFYVAPRFSTLAEINSAWVDKCVVQRSIFIAPSEIGLISDDDRHFVSYDERRAFFCSEPRAITAVSIAGLGERLDAKLHSDTRPLRIQIREWHENLRSAAERAHSQQRELHLELPR